MAVFSTWFKAQKSVPSTCPYWVGWTPTTFVRWVYKERDWWSQGHRNIGVIPKEKGRRNGFLGILMWHFASENDLRSRDFGQFHDHFISTGNRWYMIIWKLYLQWLRPTKVVPLKGAQDLKKLLSNIAPFFGSCCVFLAKLPINLLNGHDIPWFGLWAFAFFSG